LRIEKTTLDDGLTLLMERVPDVRSASLGVWLRMGSRDEPAPLSGICHFLEHLVFKGTERRTAREISLISDRIGGHLDAFTSKDTTCFFAKVLDEHVPTAVDLLSDIVRHPRFDPEDLERERGVILEEIRMVLDAPEERIYDLFCEAIWPDHPLGRPIQGTEQTIGSMQRDTVEGFFREAYVPPNLIVAMAGRITDDHVAAVREAFSDIRPGVAAEPIEPPSFRTGLWREEKQELEQVHLLAGLPGLPAGDDQRFELQMLNTILGGSLSSRLFQKVREERGLAYAVSSHVQGHQGAGLLTVHAATAPERAREVLDLALAELRAMAAEPPTDDEVEVARDHLKGSLLLALESTSARMSRAAREHMVLGRNLSLDEIVERLEAVTRESIRALCERLVIGESLALAMVGKASEVRIDEEDLKL
jgi:predicted Zn-dependent peptidase